MQETRTEHDPDVQESIETLSIQSQERVQADQEDVKPVPPVHKNIYTVSEIGYGKESVVRTTHGREQAKEIVRIVARRKSCRKIQVPV